MFKYRVIDIHPDDPFVGEIEVGQVLESVLPARLTEWIPGYETWTGFFRGRIGNNLFTAIKVEDITEHEVEPAPWIPVSDRMPEPVDKVLVWTKLGEYNTGYVFYDEEFECFACGVAESYVEITHWMPLPEPPQK